MRRGSMELLEYEEKNWPGMQGHVCQYNPLRVRSEGMMIHKFWSPFLQ